MKASFAFAVAIPALAGVHVTPGGVNVVPSLSTSIAGLGVTVSQ